MWSSLPLLLLLIPNPHAQSQLESQPLCKSIRKKICNKRETDWEERRRPLTRPDRIALYILRPGHHARRYLQTTNATTFIANATAMMIIIDSRRSVPFLPYPTHQSHSQLNDGVASGLLAAQAAVSCGAATEIDRIVWIDNNRRLGCCGCIIALAWPSK